MTFSYFPGCTLKTKGVELDRWGRASAEALGFTLRELDQWQCCGAVYPMARDEIATRLSSVRAHSRRQKAGSVPSRKCSIISRSPTSCHTPRRRASHSPRG